MVVHCGAWHRILKRRSEAAQSAQLFSDNYSCSHLKRLVVLCRDRRDLGDAPPSDTLAPMLCLHWLSPLFYLSNALHDAHDRWVALAAVAAPGVGRGARLVERASTLDWPSPMLWLQLRRLCS